MSRRLDVDALIKEVIAEIKAEKRNEKSCPTGGIIPNSAYTYNHVFHNSIDIGHLASNIKPFKWKKEIICDVPPFDNSDIIFSDRQTMINYPCAINTGVESNIQQETNNLIKYLKEQILQSHVNYTEIYILPDTVKYEQDMTSLLVTVSCSYTTKNYGLNKNFSCILHREMLTKIL